MSTHAPAGRRTIVAMAVVAVLCLGLGLVLSRLIVSPGKAAADAAPPTAGPISVPVERRVIANTVTLRGDVGYDDPEGVHVETGDLGGPAVVTGQVPAVGATLDAGAVALEITGRPVVVLPGDLPTYRSLRAGVSGPDVVQLKTALRALGIDGGDPANGAYDAAAAAGVRALYQRIGYEPPTAGAEAVATLAAARDGVTAAQRALGSAQTALRGAAAGSWSTADKVEADGVVATARARLTEAQACAAAAVDPCLPSAVVEAQSALDTAVARRAQMDAAADTSGQRADVQAAQEALTAAQRDVTKAEAATLTPLPAAEVVFLPALPRRVDQVAVQRGGAVSGDFMTVSGATIQVVADTSRADAALLAVGGTGTIDLDGTPIEVTITDIVDPQTLATDGGTGTADTAGAAASDRWRVVFALPELSDDVRWQLQGTNVRIRIPVSSTDGEVLAVPIAALTAGPGGESRVEVLDGTTTHLVTVTTGLAADGYVEIASSAEPLAAGDLVVVGVAAAGQGGGSGGGGKTSGTEAPTTGATSSP